MSISPFGNNFSNPYISSPSSLTGGTGNSGASSINFGSNYQSTSAASEQPKSSGGISGFFKGIFNGAKNAIHSLFTPKGLLMAAGATALCIAFPPAAIALGGLAALKGGSQIFQGMKDGNTEEMGEGTFAVAGGAGAIVGGGALSALGKGGEGAAATAGDAGAAEGSGGFFSNMWSKAKGIFSSNKPAPTPETATPETVAAESENAGTAATTPEGEKIAPESLAAEEETPSQLSTTESEPVPTPESSTTGGEGTPGFKDRILNSAPAQRLNTAWGQLTGKVPMPPMSGVPSGQQPNFFARARGTLQDPVIGGVPSTAILTSGPSQQG